MKRNKQVKSQSGFTIVELLIATSVFSVILLVVSTGIVRIGQSYYKGIIQSRTQETVRAVSQEISSTVQFASGQKKLGATGNQFCIGNARYTYFLNQKVDESNEGLRVEKMRADGSCSVAADGSEPKEMLAKNMRVLHFKADPDVKDSRIWRIEIAVAYGDNDLLTHYDNNGNPAGWSAVTDPAVKDAKCKSGVSGGAFCATSSMDILVKRRLN